MAKSPVQRVQRKAQRSRLRLAKKQSKQRIQLAKKTGKATLNARIRQMKKAARKIGRRR